MAAIQGLGFFRSGTVGGANDKSSTKGNVIQEKRSNAGK
jgi:hypothetical protein